MTTEELLAQYDALAEAADNAATPAEAQAALREMEGLAGELNSRGVCAKCGTSFATHNDDGSCAEDDENCVDEGLG